MRIPVLIFGLIIICVSANSQQFANWWNDVTVSENGKELYNPWTGGLNTPQFGKIDVDFDGKKDLFVFDRSVNKSYIFLNQGDVGEYTYKFLPKNTEGFPEMHDWVIIKDYNCDGLSDIFTYSLAGAAVYKNESSVGSGMKFTKQTDLVLSDYPGNPKVNLYISSIDYPAIADFDGDGDLDIATFGILGSTVEYHRNQSMEKYGNCDSLDYILETSCWGNFSENAVNNSVELNITCKGGYTLPDPEVDLDAHSGSTILVFDSDCDEDMDMVLGDVSFKNMVFLNNGGTKLNADIVSQDPAFPSNSTSVDIPIFPAGFHLDINNDGNRDLIVSSNASNAAYENFKGVWLYLNTGSDTCPVFEFVQDDFLQEQMVETGEASMPVFFDYNKDTLMDIIVGSRGYYSSSGLYKSGLMLLKNVGTPSDPSFDIIDRDFANIEQLGLNDVSPCFGDFDDDGDEDMIIGESTGKFHYFRNKSVSSEADFELAIVQMKDTAGKTMDVGTHSTPYVIDLNRDGLLDIVSGERDGFVNYYENVGTKTDPEFVLRSDTLGDVNVSDQFPGFSTPFVYDSSGTYKMLVGCVKGQVFKFENIDGNLSGAFDLTDSSLYDFQDGGRINIKGAYLNNDDKMDYVTGNTRGGVALYFGDSIQIISAKPVTPGSLKVSAFPNPASTLLTIHAPINNGQLYLYNSVGQLIMNRPFFNNSAKLDLSSLNNGAYFISIRSRNEAASTRFIKK